VETDERDTPCASRSIASNQRNAKTSSPMPATMRDPNYSENALARGDVDRGRRSKQLGPARPTAHESTRFLPKGDQSKR
jgi:hypothetical protein